MSLPTPLIEYDNLSIKLFSGLAENALSNIASSAGKMLDVACLFFDKDVSSALMDFHKLYLQHSHLDEHTHSINQQADDILQAAKQPSFSEDQLTDSAEAHSQISDLANVQKDLEALIQQDHHIKQRMVPVMQCMQYEDMISNRIQRLIKFWEYMVQLLNNQQSIDISEALTTFDGFLASNDEHEQFYQHVMGVAYAPHEKIDDHKVTDVKHNIESIGALLERIFDFSQASLNNCIDQTQQAFEELMNLLSLVTGESKVVGYLFAENSESLAEIKDILSRTKDSADAAKIINEIAATRAKHNDESSELIQSFMMALQSQDRIRQNIENVGKFHHTWCDYRAHIKSRNSFDSDQRKYFGGQILAQMTSQDERAIVEHLIPEIKAQQRDNDDELF